MSGRGQPIKLDTKTALVFKKKGYSVEKKLNEGAFGQVYKGFNTKSGEEIAVKVMDLAKVGDKFKQKFLPRELAALIGIKHEHVIYIHDIIRANHKIYIFMEFANGGDITSFLQKNGPISESLTCYWFTQISHALYYIHEELKIAHRDIKIDNVLLHNNVAKLTDFGFAKESWDNLMNKPILSETFCGTEPYYSPQIVARKPYNAFCADVWAMGVTLFCMLNNKFPFHFGDQKKMFAEQVDTNFIKTRYIKKFPSDLRHLQEQFFEYSETDRITMRQVLRHPWILRRGK
ncbi:serine/threonine protein kinase-like protein 5 [Sarcoptes scabiei]|uniref:Serine/threonine protein kinase-like protein 5 n=1 Tax=Sarcoptes scabiei TaxID=52283 RepID=A0A131ZZQ6_SARSC|nr:serine/threonine protein kinase-like protein 5 [Sarcoptes scabiei]